MSKLRSKPSFISGAEEIKVVVVGKSERADDFKHERVRFRFDRRWIHGQGKPMPMTFNPMKILIRSSRQHYALCTKMEIILRIHTSRPFSRTMPVRTRVIYRDRDECVFWSISFSNCDVESSQIHAQSL